MEPRGARRPRERRSLAGLGGVALPLAVQVGDLLLEALVLAAVVDQRGVVGIPVRLGEPGLDRAEALLGRRDLAFEPAHLAGGPLRRAPGRPASGLGLALLRRGGLRLRGLRRLRLLRGYG